MDDDNSVYALFDVESLLELRELSKRLTMLFTVIDKRVSKVGYTLKIFRAIEVERYQ
ncbi:MAG: hypothetical protein QXO91_00730 [Desulfurococcaceae archaeon]